MDTKLLAYLSGTNTLWATGLTFLALFFAFGWVHAGVGDGPLLDTLFSAEDARARIAAMTEAQRNHHLIGTAVIDMLYPLAYGSFFAGLLYRLGGAWRIQLAMIPLIGAAFDIAENLVQISALAGGPDLLGIKLFLTAPKFIAALCSLLLIGFLAGRALWRRLRG